MKIIIWNDGSDIKETATDMEAIPNMIREWCTQGKVGRTSWKIVELIQRVEDQ